MLNLFEYEKAAAGCVEASAWGYQMGGACDEVTLRANREAWDRYCIRFRTMVDVSRRSLETTVLGVQVSLPVLIAPTALQRLSHSEGEAGMARGAEAAGTLLVVSTTATTNLTDVMAASAGPKWFQVYIYADREATAALITQAVAAGYRALVLTVDSPLIGRRERDIRNRFSLPQGMTIANASVAGKEDMPDATGDASGLTHHFRGLHDPALTPRDITWLRDLSGLPVVVKGVVRGDDARKAVDHGASAIIVSNHGGRQLDSSIPTARALGEVVGAVGGAVEVYVDGGIRRGTDILKALSLGARATLIGRPALWGLAVGGAAGVEKVLQLLRDELDLAMALAGCRDVAEITRDLVAD
ncbi:MAG: alpha-hydroxy acid oxidase [Gemmatimonadota bacterium]